MGASGWTALQAHSENSWSRLQFYPDGTLQLYKNSDGGEVWNWSGEFVLKSYLVESDLTLFLTKEKDYQNFFRDMYGYYMVKSGNVVHFHANAHIKDGLVANQDYTVFTIPGTIRPPRGIRSIFTTSSSSRYLVKITDNNMDITPIEPGAGLCEINLVWILR